MKKFLLVATFTMIAVPLIVISTLMFSILMGTISLVVWLEDKMTGRNETAKAVIEVIEGLSRVTK